MVGENTLATTPSRSDSYSAATNGRLMLLLLHHHLSLTNSFDTLLCMYSLRRRGHSKYSGRLQHKQFSQDQTILSQNFTFYDSNKLDTQHDKK